MSCIRDEICGEIPPESVAQPASLVILLRNPPDPPRSAFVFFPVVLYTALMPIYEYECRQCGHRFEYLHLSSSPAATCPACQKDDLEQLISLSAMSSETTRQVNLGAAHRRAAGVRKEKQIGEHQHLHEHFHDQASGGGKSH